MLGRSWLEVSLKTLRNNYRILSERLAHGTEMMPAVKANAYGQGDIPVSLELAELGCRNFAVSNLEEAIRLRDGGISGQILILGYTPSQHWKELLHYDITQALLDGDYAAALAGHDVKAHFAVDTGMNRIGLDGDDPALCEAAIRKAAGGFRLTGLFTHLCTADTPSGEGFTAAQMEKFRRVAQSVADLELPYIHCMNSAAFLYHKPFGNLARAGIILYGLSPDASSPIPQGLEPIMRWKTSVAMIKALHPGESVSYGNTFTADREMRVATLPTGYGDGYKRSLSGKGGVLLHGSIAPVLGRVCMDQMMVDVTHIPQAAPGDTALLMGPELSPDVLAAQAGTISYEIICTVGNRVPRIYVEE